MINRRELIIAGGAIAAASSVGLSGSIAAVAAEPREINWARNIEAYLTKSGLRILPMDNKIRKLCETARLFTQYHIDLGPIPSHYKDAPTITSFHVEELAHVVLQRVRSLRRSSVRFARLWVPPSKYGVLACSSYQFAHVNARELSCYEIQTDGIMKRLDVLFEAV